MSSRIQHRRMDSGSLDRPGPYRELRVGRASPRRHLFGKIFDQVLAEVSLARVRKHGQDGGTRRRICRDCNKWVAPHRTPHRRRCRHRSWKILGVVGNTAASRQAPGINQEYTIGAQARISSPNSPKIARIRSYRPESSCCFVRAPRATSASVVEVRYS